MIYADQATYDVPGKKRLYQIFDTASFVFSVYAGYNRLKSFLTG